jgi:hypothetical protein
MTTSPIEVAKQLSAVLEDISYLEELLLMQKAKQSALVQQIRSQDMNMLYAQTRASLRDRAFAVSTRLPGASKWEFIPERRTLCVTVDSLEHRCRNYPLGHCRWLSEGFASIELNGYWAHAFLPAERYCNPCFDELRSDYTGLVEAVPAPALEELLAAELAQNPMPPVPPGTAPRPHELRPIGPNGAPVCGAAGCTSQSAWHWRGTREFFCTRHAAAAGELPASK